jgi:hypothetical protein
MEDQLVRFDLKRYNQTKSRRLLSTNFKLSNTGVNKWKTIDNRIKAAVSRVVSKADKVANRAVSKVASKAVVSKAAVSRVASKAVVSKAALSRVVSKAANRVCKADKVANRAEASKAVDNQRVNAQFLL